MPLPSTEFPQAPTALLAELRHSRAAGQARHQQTLQTWRLRPLTGGRNNEVYSWTGPETPICIKIYKLDQRQRAQREWRALTLLAHHGADYAPTPLWIDEASDQPAIGMSLLPGHPLPDVEDTTVALKSLAEITRALQEIPLSEPLASWDRIDSVEHYLTRLTELWPQQLADHTDDPLTGDMLTLLSRWHDSGDAHTLARPAHPVFSRGDSNLLNWLHDGHTLRCVDFEFSGRSDVAFDAADQIEHISSRAIPDHTWHQLEANLGVDHHNRPRFHAAQRTCALRWLAVLWKQRHRRTEEFTTQLNRVRQLQHSTEHTAT
ncbi:MAG: phosphotransferase family protein [Pseudonocardiaceae bacterium]